MAQQPAVVLIARHGQRLDISDQSWHLSTPTPYDPPITYGGWNQSRSLGVRIASLLDERERIYNSARDKADTNGSNGNGDGEDRPRKRRRLRHKVVIHTSPFLRCLQTSIGIAAGIAQYKPAVDDGYKRAVSVSPRVRATEGHITPKGLSSLGEPKHDFAHAIALRALHEHQHYRRSRLRVDAFLGEWLNPEYFEGITEPPPSAMMVATAKAELMENESVEIFQPAAVNKPTGGGSLWGGANGTSSASRESTLDDWSPVEETLPPSPSRSRASTQTDVRSNESGRKSPFRPGSPLQPLTSNLPKPETSAYHPPTPHYAVSGTQQIPRGYVAHARNACTDVDLQWDSSRQPESWGDGGEYGEEWSALHKRIRRGLNRLIHWYSREENDESCEGTVPAENSTEHGEEDVKEDLVVVMVTHGAGANALIGALTGQPVLLDIGMASLTMAERKRDAPSITSPKSATDIFGRRTSFDMGLSSLYEMRFISSSEHLRPGADTRGAASPSGVAARSSSRERMEKPRKSSTNASLGSIRRPSAANTGLSVLQNTSRSSSQPPDSSAPAVSAGLWAPAASRSPAFQATAKFLPLQDQRGRAKTAGGPVALDFGNLPPTSIPSDTGPKKPVFDEMEEDKAAEYDSDSAAELPKPGDSVPPSLSRRLSREHLWGSRPTGAQVERRINEPKRRWTVEQD